MVMVMELGAVPVQSERGGWPKDLAHECARQPQFKLNGFCCSVACLRYAQANPSWYAPQAYKGHAAVGKELKALHDGTTHGRRISRWREEHVPVALQASASGLLAL
eukprot:1145076-Pelagomonas_calceolata.AAC.4